MPARKRIKTRYPGVYYVESIAIGSKKPEQIYYIIYRRNGKLVEEKAGRQYQDDMTPAKANTIRSKRIEGKELSNKEQRCAAEAKKHAENNRWTVCRLWEAYKDSRPDLKGIVTDENRFEKHLKNSFGNKEPRAIASLDVHRMRVKLLKVKSPGTVKNVLELLRRIINFGVKNNLCEGINFTVEMPKVDSEKTEDLSPEQLSALFEVIGQSDHIIAAAMMRIALYTGVRRGEMFRLQWDDIDFERGFIVLRDPKGKKNQKIPLNFPSRQVFDSLPRGSKFVFPGRGGRQRVDINKQVNAIKKEAGLPKDFRPLHGLRHVYASMLASSGKVDMYTLQKLLTHKSPIMTQRYAHLRDETLKRAADLAGDIIKEIASDEKVLSIK